MLVSSTGVVLERRKVSFLTPSIQAESFDGIMARVVRRLPLDLAEFGREMCLNKMWPARFLEVHLS